MVGVEIVFVVVGFDNGDIDGSFVFKNNFFGDGWRG